VIAIEGPENAGKTLLFNKLKSNYKGSHIEFLEETAINLTGYFPLGTSATTETELALLCLSVKRLTESNYLLKQGKTVILDRCWISDIIYSSVRKKLCPNYVFDPAIYTFIESVYTMIYPDVINNIIVVNLNISPLVSFERWKLRFPSSNIGHYPTSEWFERAHEEFCYYFNKFKIKFPKSILVEIDGNQNMDKVFNDFLKLSNHFKIPFNYDKINNDG